MDEHEDSFIGEFEQMKYYSTLDTSNFNSTINPFQSELMINDNLSFSMFTKKPSWWWRMWQYLLLGFKWKDAK